MLAGTPDDDLVVALIPFKDGARAYTEFLSHFGGNLDLPLGGEFGLSDGHRETLPR